jgi:hypothetical protein
MGSVLALVCKMATRIDQKRWTLNRNPQKFELLGGAHTVMVKPRKFAERHGLDMATRLLTISR